jgi:hypothetical protein
MTETARGSGTLVHLSLAELRDALSGTEVSLNGRDTCPEIASLLRLNTALGLQLQQLCAQSRVVKAAHHTQHNSNSEIQMLSR